MKVLVTRPAAQAAEWVAQLAAHGIDAAALPLIGIAPAEDPKPVVAAWQALPGQALAVFVSPNAVEQFFARRPPACAWPDRRARRLTRARHDAGAAGARRGRRGDRRAGRGGRRSSTRKSLWAQLALRDWTGARVLVVRGDGGREWLADTLRAHGAAVSFVTAYRRVPPPLDAAGRALLQQATAAPAAHLWFFSSSEAVEHLAVLAPAVAGPTARALATHPRIAATARRIGFGAVHACRPTPAAVAACIQSIAP